MNSTPAIAARTGVSRRVAAIVGPALIGAVLLTSCGGDEGGATQSTIDLSASSTAFVVRTPATTVPPADTGVPGTGEGGTVEGTQEYEVQAGDYPYLIVERFAISLEDLVNVNEWGSANEFPGPGTIILIPPGGRSVAEVMAGGGDDESTETDTDTETDTGSGEETESSEPTATIPDAGDNCAEGSYTITAEDNTRQKVANAFDVTVEALDAANAGTPGYSAFYPGLEIVIPAKSDC
jgi:hypothetical protein